MPFAANVIRARLPVLMLMLVASVPHARASVMANAFSYTISPYRPSRDNTVAGASSAISVDPYGFSSAAVDQATGTMHLSSHGQFGAASVEIDETIRPSYTGTFTYTFELTGSIHVSPVQSPYVDGSGYSMQFGVGAQSCSTAYFQTGTPASTTIDRYLTGVCSVTKGQSTNLRILASVHTSGTISSADFSNTGIFHIDVPAGQSLGYADSDFLSDPQPFETVAVPEPAGVASFAAGLVALAVARRRRPRA